MLLNKDYTCWHLKSHLWAVCMLHHVQNKCHNQKDASANGKYMPGALNTIYTYIDTEVELWDLKLNIKGVNNSNKTISRYKWSMKNKPTV